MNATVEIESPSEIEHEVAGDVGPEDDAELVLEPPPPVPAPIVVTGSPTAVRVTIVALAAFIIGAAAGLARAEPVSGGVRFGAHPTYDRVVFDWTETVDYRVATEGRRVTLTFGQTARLDAPRIAAALARVASD